MEIYLDNAATTKPWPQVVRAVVEAMEDGFGNASSLHRRGLAAARRISDAKIEIERLVGSGPWKIVFTSGGCESDTMAVLGTAPRGKRNHIVTTTLEHSAVEEACVKAEESGCAVTVVKAGVRGVVDPSHVALAVTDHTVLVTVNHVAHEMGTVQPVAEIARAVKARAPRCRVHVDAVQAVAQLDKVSYPPEVDMVTLSAHKIHGPQGVGVLLLRPHLKPRQLIFGGDQQDGLRPGTFNLPGIVGFGEAARLFCSRRESQVPRMRHLAERFIHLVEEGSKGVRVLGDPEHRAAGLVVLGIENIRGEVLLHALEMRGVLASAGAACHATRKELPRCLVDAGLSNKDGAVRISLTLDTTDEAIEIAASHFKEALAGVRSGRAGAL